MLPHAEVQTFDGDPVNYCNFICYFKNLIEAKMKTRNTKLYYQYKSGDVHELKRSCLSMQTSEGMIWPELQNQLHLCYQSQERTTD